MLSLPNEIIIFITSKLNILDIINLSQVNKKLYNISECDIIYKQLLNKSPLIINFDILDFEIDDYKRFLYYAYITSYNLPFTIYFYLREYKPWRRRYMLDLPITESDKIMSIYLCNYNNHDRQLYYDLFTFVDFRRHYNECYIYNYIIPAIRLNDYNLVELLTLDIHNHNSSIKIYSDYLNSILIELNKIKNNDIIELFNAKYSHALLEMYLIICIKHDLLYLYKYYNTIHSCYFNLSTMKLLREYKRYDFIEYHTDKKSP